MLFCRLLIFFFKINFLEKIPSGIAPECQTVWIQIRPDILLCLIWVQTVCKCYQQTTLVSKDLMLILFLMVQNFAKLNNICTHIGMRTQNLLFSFYYNINVYICR